MKNLNVINRRMVTLTIILFALLLFIGTAQAQAEIDRLIALDDALANTDITGVKLQRIETYINNIGSYDDLKKVLIRIVRYIAANRSSP